MVSTMTDRRFLIVLPGCAVAFIAGFYLFSGDSDPAATPPVLGQPAAGRAQPSPVLSEPEKNRPRRGDATAAKDDNRTSVVDLSTPSLPEAATAKFVGPQGDFKVAFPEKPQIIEPTPPEGVKSMRTYTAADGELRFTVTRSELKEDPKSPKGPASLLAGVVQGLTKSAKQKPAVTDIAFNQHPGREVTFVTAEGLHARAKVYLVNNRTVFIVMLAAAQKDLLDDVLAELFLASFEII
jgi:hypothetical protein